MRARGEEEEGGNPGSGAKSLIAVYEINGFGFGFGFRVWVWVRVRVWVYEINGLFYIRIRVKD